ncbi:putative Por secretion system C-terminal sorting domain-containing protein [Flavobacterium sp. 9AF]|uniref:T9SS type A sorting domain-containing protein n=1 Tax=Flavobacterium sp. 9AF TaxID=2653142 RepID=UPI0012EF578C|nr:T9SS type A sorting domain-containing protein [Flavobacterium sp. 9AF]VXA94661.1 putative Por secretion system C-terminal sorting domain-containing protein [Flavobacterium sp. 9AF]
MKKRLLFILVGVVSTFAQTPDRKFSFTNGSLTDDLSAAFITPVGNARTLIADRTNTANNAITINSDYLAFSMDNLMSQSFTVSFFIKTSDNNLNTKILVANRANNYTGLGYVLGLRVGKLELFPQMEVTTQFTSSGSYNVAPIFQNFGNIGTYSVNNNQWHHVVLVGESFQNPGSCGFNFKIYVDGNIDSQPQLMYPYQTAQQTYISHTIVNTNLPLGITQNTTYKYSDGFDDLWYFTTALTPAQIASLVTTLDIDDFTIESNLIFYPNPVNNILNIQSIDEVEAIEIFSLTGQKIVSNKFDNKIDISSLQSGIYLVEIKTVSGKKVAKKIMKNNEK